MTARSIAKKELDLIAMLSDPKIMAYLTPAGLAMYCSNGAWKPARHLLLLQEYILAVVAGEIKRLIVLTPPRHGKSELLSKYTPAWFLGRFPDDRVILASYEADFASSWGRKSRDILEEHGPEVFDVSVSASSSAANRWDLHQHSGGMNSVGVGGAITGKGAELFLIDDPVKGPEEAMSKLYRDRAWEWFQSVAYTRLTPTGKIILTMTRWNEDDLAGRILKNATEKWTVLSLPAYAEAGDIMGRAEGDVLWPEKFGPDILGRIENELSAYWWGALYQQHPSPQEGGIIKRNWVRYYKGEPPKCTQIIQSWDMAFKDLTSSAYVCGQAWGKCGPDLYLLDLTRKKLDFPATLREFRLFTKDNPLATAKLIEEAANGYAVIQVLKTEIPGIIPITAQGSKESRASAISYLWEAGNVYVPEDRVWTDDFIEECVTFPNGTYKDQVDTMTQALFRLRGKQSLVVSPGGTEKTSIWRGEENAR